MSNTPLSFAAIGCGGRLRTVIAHLLKALSRPVVIRVFDPNPEAIKAARAEWPAEIVSCSSWAEALDAPEVNWAFVGSWNAAHREHVVAAFEAGKHVFAEKPLATTLSDCVAMRDAHEASGKMFFFGLVLRYAPLYQRIFEISQAGAIGKIVSFEFNETLGFNHGAFIHGNWRRNICNSGPHILEKCCHDIDVAQWLVQSVPVQVASFGGLNFFTPENRSLAARLDEKEQRRMAGTQVRCDPFDGKQEIVDNQVAILEYANGVRATFHTNCSAGLHERRFYLVGTEGGLRADAATSLIETQPIELDSKIEETRIVFEEGGEKGHAGGDAVMARYLAESILDGKPPIAGMREAMLSAITCFGIDQAMKEKRVVDLRPIWRTVGIEIDECTEVCAKV